MASRKNKIELSTYDDCDEKFLDPAELRIRQAVEIKDHDGDTFIGFVCGLETKCIHLSVMHDTGQGVGDANFTIRPGNVAEAYTIKLSTITQED